MSKNIIYTVIYISIIIIIGFVTIENNSAYRSDFPAKGEVSLCGVAQTSAFKSKNSITVTSIETEELVGKHFVSVTINNLIKIKEILIIEENGRKFIKFPEYITKDDKVYPQIVIVNKEGESNIEEAITSGVSTAGEIEELNYKITKLFLLQGKSRRANVEVTFNDELKIICGVMEDKTGGLWIAWPSRKDVELGWIKQVIFLNQKFQKMVEKEILAKYTAAKSEKPD